MINLELVACSDACGLVKDNLRVHRCTVCSLSCYELAILIPAAAKL